MLRTSQGNRAMLPKIWIDKEGEGSCLFRLIQGWLLDSLKIQ